MGDRQLVESRQERGDVEILVDVARDERSAQGYIDRILVRSSQLFETR